MKKTYIIIFLIIVAGIIITPFIFIANIPKNYLQINQNDEYTWKQTFYQPSFADFSDDSANLYDYRNLENVDRIKITVENISDEIISGECKYKLIGIAYFTSQNEYSNDWTLNSSINSILIYDYNSNNYSFSDIIQAPLIFSANANWENLANVLKTKASQIIDLDSYDIQPLYNGLNIIMDYNHTEIIKENIQYNEKGVLSSFTIHYSDILTIEKNLEFLIDGFSLSVLILFCVPFIIGIVSILLKKIKNLN